MSLKYWPQALHILYDGYIHMKIQRYFKKLFCNLNILKQNNFYHSLHTHSVYQISNILFKSILRILSPKFDKYKHTGHKHVSNTCNQFSIFLHVHFIKPHLLCLSLQVSLMTEAQCSLAKTLMFEM